MAFPTLQSALDLLSSQDKRKKKTKQVKQNLDIVKQKLSLAQKGGKPSQAPPSLSSGSIMYGSGPKDKKLEAEKRLAKMKGNLDNYQNVSFMSPESGAKWREDDFEKRMQAQGLGKTPEQMAKLKKAKEINKLRPSLFEESKKQEKWIKDKIKNNKEVRSLYDPLRLQHVSYSELRQNLPSVMKDAEGEYQTFKKNEEDREYVTHVKKTLGLPNLPDGILKKLDPAFIAKREEQWQKENEFKLRPGEAMEQLRNQHLAVESELEENRLSKMNALDKSLYRAGKASHRVLDPLTDGIISGLSFTEFNSKSTIDKPDDFLDKSLRLTGAFVGGMLPYGTISKGIKIGVSGAAAFSATTKYKNTANLLKGLDDMAKTNVLWKSVLAEATVFNALEEATDAVIRKGVLKQDYTIADFAMGLIFGAGMGGTIQIGTHKIASKTLKSQVEAMDARYKETKTLNSLMNMPLGDTTFKTVFGEQKFAYLRGMGNHKARPGIDTPAPLPKSDDLSMFAVHNLSEDNFRFADKIGGLANPSLALFEPHKQGFSGFGEITLVAPKDLIDPKQMRKGGVYAADVYSPRFPMVDDIVSHSSFKEIEGYLKKHDASAGEGVENLDILNDARRSLEDSNHLMLEFLESKGEKPNIIRDADGGVDFYKTRSSLREQIDGSSEFKSFLDDFLKKYGAEQKIFAGYTPSGRKKYKDLTVGEASKIMGKKVQGTEGHFYGLGSVRAKLTKKFKSIKEIKGHTERLTSKAEMEKEIKFVEEEFDKLVEHFMDVDKRPSSNTFGGYSNTYALLGDYMAGEDVKFFIDKFGTPSKSIQKRVDSLRDRLRHMPTEYFEAKFTRPVGLEEFGYALVPKTANKKTIESLTSKGIEVKLYDPQDPGARRKILQELMEEQRAAPDKGRRLGKGEFAFMRGPEGDASQRPGIERAADIDPKQKKSMVKPEEIKTQINQKNAELKKSKESLQKMVLDEKTPIKDIEKARKLISTQKTELKKMRAEHKKATGPTKKVVVESKKKTSEAEQRLVDLVTDEKATAKQIQEAKKQVLSERKTLEELEIQSAKEMAPSKKKSKVGKTIMEKGVKERLIKTFEDTAEYDTINLKDQARKAADLVSEDLPRARRILAGTEGLPSDLRATSLITAMESHAIKARDPEILKELASSKLTSETSIHAQEMRLMAERSPLSPLAAMQKIREARAKVAMRRKVKDVQKSFKTMFKDLDKEHKKMVQTGEKVRAKEIRAEQKEIQKEIKKLSKVESVDQAKRVVVKTIKAEIKKVAPKKNDWESFMDSITC